MKNTLIATVAFGLFAVSLAQTQPFTNTDLVGTWQSQVCEKLEIGTQTSFIKRNFVLTTSTWQLRYTIFADPNCTVGLLTSRLVGPYTLGDSVGNLERTRKITWGQTAKFMTPHVPAILETFNNARCGDTAAALNVERDISQTGCLAFGTPSVKDYSAEYDLLSLQGGKLFTGLRRDQMNIEANRPVTLFNFPLVKQ